MRSSESRIGLTHESRTCGRLSRTRKPCEKPTEPYNPWCFEHCSEEEREFGSLLRRVYREGYEQGVWDRARKASDDEWQLRDRILAQEELRKRMQNYRIGPQPGDPEAQGQDPVVDPA